MSVRDMWFEEFKKYFYWHQPHAKKIRDNFEFCGGNRLKEILSEARKKPDTKPTWLVSEFWDELKAFWMSDDFKKRSETAKANRNVSTSVGSSLHTGGSIPTSEIKRRLEKEKGEKISSAELFLHTHQRKANKEWVDNNASQAYENFVAKWQNIQSTQASDRESTHEISETDAWVKEHTTKKGGVYGLGSEGRKYKGSCSSVCVDQATQNISHSFTFEEVNESIQRALETQAQKNDEKLQIALETQNQKHEEQLEKVLEMQNKKMKNYK